MFLKPFQRVSSNTRSPSLAPFDTGRERGQSLTLDSFGDNSQATRSLGFQRERSTTSTVDRGIHGAFWDHHSVSYTPVAGHFSNVLSGRRFNALVI